MRHENNISGQWLIRDTFFPIVSGKFQNDVGRCIQSTSPLAIIQVSSKLSQTTIFSSFVQLLNRGPMRTNHCDEDTRDVKERRISKICSSVKCWWNIIYRSVIYTGVF